MTVGVHIYLPTILVRLAGGDSGSDVDATEDAVLERVLRPRVTGPIVSCCNVDSAILEMNDSVFNIRF